MKKTKNRLKVLLIISLVFGSTILFTMYNFSNCGKNTLIEHERRLNYGKFNTSRTSKSTSSYRCT